jgi:hypothetical protein
MSKRLIEQSEKLTLSTRYRHHSLAIGARREEMRFNIPMSPGPSGKHGPYKRVVIDQGLPHFESGKLGPGPRYRVGVVLKKISHYICGLMTPPSGFYTSHYHPRVIFRTNYLSTWFMSFRTLGEFRPEMTTRRSNGYGRNMNSPLATSFSLTKFILRCIMVGRDIIHS